MNFLFCLFIYVLLLGSATIDAEFGDGTRVKLYGWLDLFSKN
jgi:hypothetical protein